MPVTRQSSLTSEKFAGSGEASTASGTGVVIDLASRPEWRPHRPTKVQMVGFTDWLSIYQRHYRNDLPKIADGAVMRIDKHGEVETVTLKKSRIEGSHETAVFLRCDGETVWFEGNVSKLGRPDNVFGYTFLECLQIINDLLQRHGLPPFTEGERYFTNFKGEPRSVWTGAVVTRIDLTCNFATGSKEDAYAYMRHLQGQQASRLKTGTYGDGETVDFGRGSRSHYIKAYLKGPELRRHAGKVPDAQGIDDGTVKDYEKGISNPYVHMLANWCDAVGLVRVEMTFKATKLHNLGCHYLGAFDMKQLELEFERLSEVFTRGSAEADDFSLLPKAVLSTYRMWQAGDDLTTKLSRATFYRHRRELLAMGVDIAIKSNVVPLKTRTRVIKLGPVSMPDWYELPPPERNRYGTHG
ncbi:phage/plasmid replication protein, II/X family [Delftia lacustris]